MKKIIKAIRDWYKGDDGEPKYNFITQVYEYKRQPSRHWTAKLTGYLLEPVFTI